MLRNYVIFSIVIDTLNTPLHNKLSLLLLRLFTLQQYPYLPATSIAYKQNQLFLLPILILFHISNCCSMKTEKNTL
jgi:hypothetical protein